MTDPLTLRIRPSSSRLLARILETPDLAAQVQALPAPVLAKLIDRVGLEDAGELVALATTEQLAQVFDEDLWSNDRPGEEERFDAGRFVVWLEVMREAGDPFVARKLGELPEDLVTLAIHRHVLVISVDDLMAEFRAAGEDADSTEKALSDCLSEELDEYQLFSRQNEGWDVVLAAILALDQEDHTLLMRILGRCADMSAAYIEEQGGLYQVLTSEEMLEADVAGGREDRRAEAGHVAPTTAAAFLKLARAPSPQQPPHVAHDSVTQAYFRDLRRTGTPAPAVESAPGAKDHELVRLLRDGGVVNQPAAVPRLKAAPSRASVAHHEPLMSRAMRRLSEENAPRFAEESEHIAYLANVLASGCSNRGRRLRPVEAVRAAIATVSLGIELVLGSNDASDDVEGAARVLGEYPADGLFRVAWGRLHVEVVGPAAEIAVEWLSNAAARSDEGDAGKTLSRAAMRIRQAAAQGTPWKALPELEHMVGLFEPSVVDALRGFLDECPWMSAAFADLVPAPEGQRGTGEDDFLASLSDLRRVGVFLARRPKARPRTPARTRAVKGGRSARER